MFVCLLRFDALITETINMKFCTLSEVQKMTQVNSLDKKRFPRNGKKIKAALEN